MTRCQIILSKSNFLWESNALADPRATFRLTDKDEADPDILDGLLITTNELPRSIPFLEFRFYYKSRREPCFFSNSRTFR